MTPTAPADPTASGEPAEPTAPAAAAQGWTRHLGGAVSLVLLGAVVWQLTRLDFAQVWQMMPSSPLFWLIFATAYASGIAFDWILFHRLWNLPPGGVVALLRKMVSNQIVIGYSGEAYLYAWAKKNPQVTSAPFAAIKDVAILSALAGNLSALVLLAACWPFLGRLDLGAQGSAFALSIGAVLAISFGITLLRNKIFTLPGRELWFILTVHLARIATQLVLMCLLWLVLLPGTSLVWLLLLGTLRTLIARLPLLANKDLPFAAAAALLIGSQNALTNAIALTATLTMAAHLLVGIALVAGWGLGRVGVKGDYASHLLGRRRHRKERKGARTPCSAPRPVLSRSGPASRRCARRLPAPRRRSRIRGACPSRSDAAPRTSRYRRSCAGRTPRYRRNGQA